MTSGSYTDLATSWQEIAHSISAGIQGELVSASRPMITLPPGVACGAGAVVGPASDVGASLPPVAAVSGATEPLGVVVPPLFLSPLPPPHAPASRPNAAAVAPSRTNER